MHPSQAAKQILDILHRQYVKRQSGTLYFTSNGEPIVFHLQYGDVTAIQGGPLERGEGFQGYLSGEISDVIFNAESQPLTGYSVERGMEMLLFELAVGMDQQLAKKLDDVRKTGRLPKEAVRTAVVNYTVEEEEESQQVFILKEGVTTIGRSEDNDISLCDPGMSRHHAQITLMDGKAVIEDLDSANGIRLNRKLIKKAALAEGNLIFVGHSVFRFFWSECGNAILFNMQQDETGTEDQNTQVIPK